MKNLISILTACFWILLSCSVAAVQPARIFTNGMVLQSDEPVRIWGSAEPGETVSVTFAGQTQTALSNDLGEWMVTLDPLPVSATPRDLILRSASGTEPLRLSDILVGEVWLAGGQSNMATTLGNYGRSYQADLERAPDPHLRFVTIPRLEVEGQNTHTPQWQQATPQTLRGFSATAYFFARHLRDTLNVPVGIISCSVGATPAEAWMSRDTLESTPELQRILAGYDQAIRKFPTDAAYEAAFVRYQEAFAAYQRNRDAQSAAGPPPQQPMGPKNYQRPCGLYETMLRQTIPFTVRGVIWYQGEHNANQQNGHFYRTVFPALIQQWRKEFMNPELPFLFVQLATFGPASDPNPYWPELRDAQRWVEEQVPGTGMVVLADGGAVDNIHPHSKDKAGKRLGLLARQMIYSESGLVARGPKLTGVEKNNGALVLRFAQTGSGLKFVSLPESAFELAGKDGTFYPARVTQQGDALQVASDEVPSPEWVRYGWKKWFIPTLFNQEGLPASPFSTDPRPQVTEGRYYLDRY